MRISTVTITGADDSTSPDDMLAIARDFPFVEWGILLSYTREGTPRYPGADAAVGFLSRGLLCASHLCGMAAEDFILGLGRPGDEFRRIQVNINFSRHPELLSRIDDGRRVDPVVPVIFQMNQANQAIRDVAGVSHLLFDASRGQGVSPGAWPAPIDGINCGYAGGLGPDNLAEQLERIAAVAGDSEVWIDMESGVRTDDGEKLDFAKVARCLEIASPYVV